MSPEGERDVVTFLGLIAHNVAARKLRSGLTAVAVAIGVMAVVTLAVVTSSLRETAAAILETGQADFTVAQQGVSDVLYSSIDEADVEAIAALPGVASAVGVLVAIEEIDADHPLFLEIGVAPDALPDFGVTIVEGRAYDPLAEDEVMLGFRAAEELDAGVGDEVVFGSDRYEVVGVFATGQVFGDSGAMLPLIPLQAGQRKPGVVTLVPVRVESGADIEQIRAQIEEEHPQLTTVRTESEFGRVDRNLTFIEAAERAAIVLALVIGAVIVMNTMLLSFFERTREFGVLRAVGWTPTGIVGLVVGEALLISLLGAAVGVTLSWLGVLVLEELPALRGVLDAEFGAGDFGRALVTAAAVGLAGAVYPAVRAARLVPLEALRRE